MGMCVICNADELDGKDRIFGLVVMFRVGWRRGVSRERK